MSERRHVGVRLLRSKTDQVGNSKRFDSFLQISNITNVNGCGNK